MWIVLFRLFSCFSHKNFASVESYHFKGLELWMSQDWKRECFAGEKLELLPRNVTRYVRLWTVNRPMKPFKEWRWVCRLKLKPFGRFVEDVFFRPNTLWNSSMWWKDTKHLIKADWNEWKLLIRKKVNLIAHFNEWTSWHRQAGQNMSGL